MGLGLETGAADLPPGLRQSILGPLAQDTAAKKRTWHPVPVVLGLIGPGSSQPEGGLIGTTHWGWLRVEILAVPQAIQGQGWGQRLLLTAETVARERGCHAAWVDTFSFQAPGFYEKLGYQLFGQLEDYPEDCQRKFYQKRLTAK